MSGKGKKLSFVLPLSVIAALAISLMSGVAEAGGRHDGRGVEGAVYTMTNAPGGNAVLMFHRSSKGLLTPAGSFPTGGSGTGSGLGNQGALALSEGNRWLFVVNPGSGDISVFRVRPDGLTLVDRHPSGGVLPVSVIVDRRILYVLNADGNIGGRDNISGFIVGHDGSLSPLPGSSRPLSSPSTGPAQVSFTPDGQFLVITEKATNLIDIYRIRQNGLASDVTPNLSEGPTPFGFAFGKRDLLFVSEAAGGASEAGSMSSYEINRDGTLQVVNSAVPTTETAACWVVVTNDGRYAYTTNAGSGSISGYRIAFDGTITLLDLDGRTGVTGDGSGPIDMAISDNGRYLYTLNGGNGTIAAFRIGSDGSLDPLPGASGIPATANGLAAR
jgi:6-phosphogluconolactonase